MPNDPPCAARQVRSWLYTVLPVDMAARCAPIFHDHDVTGREPARPPTMLRWREPCSLT